MTKPFYVPDPYIIRPNDQVADGSKVMNSLKKPDGWISVKDRLPLLGKNNSSLRRKSVCVLIVSYDVVYVAHLVESWGGRQVCHFEACDCSCRGHDIEIDEWSLDQVTHWMPLPEPPKEEK